MSNRYKGDDFLALQTEWYRRLEETGFTDIEDHTHSDKPLKKWSGVSSENLSIIDIVVTQPAEKEIVSSFPEPIFTEEEKLFHHPNFDSICNEICSHYNHKLTGPLIAQVWDLYINGSAERVIAQTLAINDSAVHRTIKKLTEYMNLMDVEQPLTEEKVETVVLRPFEPEIDLPFIYSSWRNSLWYDEKRDETKADKFYRLATREIKFKLRDPHSSVRIARLDSNASSIVGYSVFIGKNLEFLYVKADYRNQGIGSLLAKGFETISDPLTKAGRAIALTHKLKVKEEDGRIKEEARTEATT